MTITKIQCSRLFDDLEKVGWHRRDGFLYAPHETMWLRIAEPWTGDLQSFHDSMVRRLKGYHNLKAHQSESENKNGVDDVTSLIQVLHRMISMGDQWPNKSPEPTRVGAVSSASRVRVIGRGWLSFLR